MTWDQMNKAREESSIFIKLKDGQSIEGAFVGEPHIFYQKYQDRTEYPDWAEGLSFKFKMNFILKDGMKCKIYTGGATVRDSLIDNKNEYGLDAWYKITRIGSGQKDTRYTIFYKGPISEEEKAQINEIKLFELGTNNAEMPPVDDVPMPTDDDMPF